MAALVCRRCLGQRQTVERNGVGFERSEECGGIFFSRGELEQLARAESMSNRTTSS